VPSFLKAHPMVRKSNKKKSRQSAPCDDFDPIYGDSLDQMFSKPPTAPQTAITPPILPEACVDLIPETIPETKLKGFKSAVSKKISRKNRTYEQPFTTITPLLNSVDGVDSVSCTLSEKMYNVDTNFHEKACGMISDFLRDRNNRPKSDVYMLLITGPPGCGKSYVVRKAIEAVGLERVDIDVLDYGSDFHVQQALTQGDTSMQLSQDHIKKKVRAVVIDAAESFEGPHRGVLTSVFNVMSKIINPTKHMKRKRGRAPAVINRWLNPIILTCNRKYDIPVGTIDLRAIPHSEVKCSELSQRQIRTLLTKFNHCFGGDMGKWINQLASYSSDMNYLLSQMHLPSLASITQRKEQTIVDSEKIVSTPINHTHDNAEVASKNNIAVSWADIVANCRMQVLPGYWNKQHSPFIQDKQQFQQWMSTKNDTTVNQTSAEVGGLNLQKLPGNWCMDIFSCLNHVLKPSGDFYRYRMIWTRAGENIERALFNSYPNFVSTVPTAKFPLTTDKEIKQFSNNYSKEVHAKGLDEMVELSELLSSRDLAMTKYKYEPEWIEYQSQQTFYNTLLNTFGKCKNRGIDLKRYTGYCDTKRFGQCLIDNKKREELHFVHSIHQMQVNTKLTEDSLLPIDDSYLLSKHIGFYWTRDSTGRFVQMDIFENPDEKGVRGPLMKTKNNYHPKNKAIQAFSPKFTIPVRTPEVMLKNFPKYNSQL
jgi:hypothetical protein